MLGIVVVSTSGCRDSSISAKNPENGEEFPEQLRSWFVKSNRETINLIVTALEKRGEEQVLASGYVVRLAAEGKLKPQHASTICRIAKSDPGSAAAINCSMAMAIMPELYAEAEIREVLEHKLIYKFDTKIFMDFALHTVPDQIGYSTYLIGCLRRNAVSGESCFQMEPARTDGSRLDERCRWQRLHWSGVRW